MALPPAPDYAAMSDDDLNTAYAWWQRRIHEEWGIGHITTIREEIEIRRYYQPLVAERVRRAA
jgi:hypothetical protein